MELRFAKKKEDYEKARRFFQDLDSRENYFPPLSQREGGLEQYLVSPNENGRIVLMERDGDVTGALAYHRDGEVVQMEITGLIEERRKSIDLYRILKYAFENDSLGSDKSVRVMTWSANDDMRKVLGRLEFKRTNEIRGHLDENRTSEFYEISVEELRRFFNRSGKKQSPVINLTGWKKKAAELAAGGWAAGVLWTLYECIRDPQSAENIGKAMSILGG